MISEKNHSGGPASEHLYTSTFFISFTYNFLFGILFTTNSLYPLYVTHCGGSAATIGLFMATFSLAAMACRPLVGFLIDRWGIKPVLCLGWFSFVLPPFCYYLLLDAGLVPLVWLIRFVQGFGWGAHFSAFFTMAARNAPEGRRNEAIGMYGVSGMLANLVGPYLGERIIESAGLSTFFLILSGVGISALFLLSRVRVLHTDSVTSTHILRGIKTVLQSPGIPFVFLMAVCLAVAHSSIFSFLAPLSKSRGIAGFGLFFTVYSISGFTIRLIGSHWGERFGLWKVLMPSFAVYGMGLLAIHCSQSLAGILFAAFLCGCAHGIVFPAITSLGYGLVPSLYAGSGIALVTGMMDGGAAVNSLFLGQIANLFGFNVIYPLAAVVPLCAGLFIFLYLAKLPEPSTRKETY